MKRLDKMIIVVVLLISAIAIAFIIFSNTDHSDDTIIIQVGSKVVKEIPLSNSNESKIYEFNFEENQGYIEVKFGKVRMVEMNKEICPKSICSDTGWIYSQYQSIVCLPNKIIITIESTKDLQLDANV